MSEIIEVKKIKADVWSGFKFYKNAALTMTAVLSGKGTYKTGMDKNEQLKMEEEGMDPEEYQDMLVQRDVFLGEYDHVMRTKLPYKTAKRPITLQKPKNDDEARVYDLIKKGIIVIDQINPGMYINHFERSDDLDNGCLPLNQVYFLCDTNDFQNDFILERMFNQLEEYSQNGICAYEFKLKDGEEFDPEKFDLSLIGDLEEFHHMLEEAAGYFETKNKGND